MPDATYVGAGMPCGICGSPLTPTVVHKCGRTVERPTANPYRAIDDEFDHAAEALTWDEGFTAGLQKHDGGLWELAFAAGRAAERAANVKLLTERDDQLRAEAGGGGSHGSLAMALGLIERGDTE